VPEDGPYETVGGWLMSELGRLPKVGDVVETDDGAFRVERLDGRRIDRIRFTPTPDDVVEATATEPGRRDGRDERDRSGRRDPKVLPEKVRTGVEDDRRAVRTKEVTR